MKLDIIIKTCDVKNMHGSTQERFCKTDKLTLIKKCLSSIVIASNNRPYETKLTVVDDGSSTETINSIAKILEKMVATQLVNHLELNNLLYSMRQKSCPVYML